MDKGSHWGESNRLWTKEWVDRMIWKAKTIYKADWIINADADELWYSPSGNLKQTCRPPMPTYWIAKWEAFIRKRTSLSGSGIKLWNLSVNRNATIVYLFHIRTAEQKVIHRSAGYLQISMGNHKVTMLPQLSTDSGIRIYHYNIRGKQQFLERW